MRHGATHARRRVELTDEPTRRRHGAMHAERVEGARSAWGEQRITSPTHTQRCPLLPPGVPCARARCVRPYFPSLPKKHVRSPRWHDLLHSKYAWLTCSRRVFALFFALLRTRSHLDQLNVWSPASTLSPRARPRPPSRTLHGRTLLKRSQDLVPAHTHTLCVRTRDMRQRRRYTWRERDRHAHATGLSLSLTLTNLTTPSIMRP